MEIDGDHIFRGMSSLYMVFKRNYFGKSDFEIAKKVPINLDYYKSTLGYEKGFYEHEIGLLQSFREYFKSSPDEIMQSMEIAKHFSAMSRVSNEKENTPENFEERLKEYFVSLDKYEVALDIFVSERNLQGAKTGEKDHHTNSGNDKRRSNKQPTNPEKLRALMEFAPDLIKSLHKVDKQTQGKILFMITGVNPNDAYQMTFTARKREVDKVELSDLDLYVDLLKEGENKST